MWRYTLLFAAIHFSLAILMGLLAAGLHLNTGSSLGVLAVFAAAYCIGWLFVKRRKRLFSISERRSLIAECLGYLLLFELFTLWANPEIMAKLPETWQLAAFAFTIGFDLLVLWLLFRYSVHKMMQKQLDVIG